MIYLQKRGRTYSLFCSVRSAQIVISHCLSSRNHNCGHLVTIICYNISGISLGGETEFVPPPKKKVLKLWKKYLCVVIIICNALL